MTSEKENKYIKCRCCHCSYNINDVNICFGYNRFNQQYKTCGICRYRRSVATDKPKVKPTIYNNEQDKYLKVYYWVEKEPKQVFIRYKRIGYDKAIEKANKIVEELKLKFNIDNNQEQNNEDYNKIKEYRVNIRIDNKEKRDEQKQQLKAIAEASQGKIKKL